MSQASASVSTTAARGASSGDQVTGRGAGRVNGPRSRERMILAACVAPVAVMSAYLLPTRWLLSRWPWLAFTRWSDWAALAVSLAVGVGILARYPIRPAGRVLVISLYLPFAVGYLLVYSIYFVGIVFGHWL